MPKEDISAKMKPLVKQYHKSGQTRKAFASVHGISEPKLDYWIKKLSKSAPKNNKALWGSDFVPLEVNRSPLSSPGHLVIRLRSGIEIEIPL
jgi:transposase-like protein